MASYNIAQNQLISVNAPMTFDFKVTAGPARLYLCTATEYSSIVTEDIAYAVVGVNNPITPNYGYSSYSANATTTSRVYMSQPATLYIRARETYCTVEITEV